MSLMLVTFDTSGGRVQCTGNEWEHKAVGVFFNLLFYRGGHCTAGENPLTINWDNCCRMELLGGKHVRPDVELHDEAHWLLRCSRINISALRFAAEFPYSASSGCRSVTQPSLRACWGSNHQPGPSSRTTNQDHQPRPGGKTL